jgi:hypothetical protein
LEFGTWNLGLGIWYLEFGTWNLGLGIWYLGLKQYRTMKTTAEKSVHTTPAADHQKRTQPFFAKAEGERFFAPVKQTAPSSVQTKLNVNKPGDKFEQEADSTAEKVMRMPAVGSKGITPSSGEDKKIQRKETGSAENEERSETGNRDSGISATPETESAIRARTSGGQPLPGETRNFMEPRFGNDFSNVRIHTDSGSAQLNNQLNARAFTYQNHIFFGQNQFQPHSPQGQHLLAHELTHVVQQGASKPLKTQSTHRPDNATPTLQAKPSQTGTPAIQRGILDVISAGAGAVSSVFNRIVSNVSRAIGAGISAATTWIQNIAGRIGAGIENTWTFISNVASRIGQGLQASWNFIQSIASRIGQTVTTAWGWIQNIAGRIGITITSAWSWVEGVASRLGLTNTLAWSWVQALASRIGHTLTNAWNWIDGVATRIGMTLTTAWNWIQQVAGIIKTAVTSAWNWVQNMANRLGMMADAAWNWVQNMASRVMMAVTAAWNWALSMASRIGMVITSAWNFIVNIATRIANTVLRAWELVKQMASQLRMAITTAWNWAVAMANRIGLIIVSAWNRIVSIARRMASAIISAWSWLISVAARIAKTVLSAWKWVKKLALRLGRAIVAAWNWIVNIAVRIGKAIVRAFNWLINLAKRLMRSIAEAWDWYLHAPDIEIETAISAPDGSGKSRKKIGVGERVTFTGSKTGEWKATGGAPLTQATGLSFIWTAPGRSESVTISLTSGKYTRTIILNVLEPNAIKAKKKNEIGFPRRRMGAGMKLKFHYHPKTVSFGNIDAKEVSGPDSNRRGYFKDHPDDYRHDSGDTFFPVNDNNEDSATDTASIQGYPSPWKAGGFDWIIPNHFKLKTEAGDGKKFTDVTQSFVLKGADGTTQVLKGGETVERSP